MHAMPAATSTKGIAAIVGVGPNLGRSIARKFAREGYTVAILSRDLAKLSQFADEIAREAMAQVFAIRIDCSSSKSVREAFESILSVGFIEVLVYNACEPCLPCGPPRFADITVEAFERSLSVSAVGAFHCAKQIVPAMAERGRGTILFTGSSASVTGFASSCELSCGKFALRALSLCLAREFQASGIHVAHVIIGGAIGTSGSSSSPVEHNMDGAMDPDALAQAYWQLHVQAKGAWSQEIDLRSSDQRF